MPASENIAFIQLDVADEARAEAAVEGLWLSVATEVKRFGIKITVVEPGFFRTDLLDARNVRWPSNVIEDYAAEGNIPETWSAPSAG
jgi:NAD(P)-dependent dehydrogenase (short-subunit alcohol dehydrogenase family)